MLFFSYFLYTSLDNQKRYRYRIILDGASYSSNFDGNINSGQLVALDNTFGQCYRVIGKEYFDDMDRIFVRKPKPKRKKKTKCKLRTILNKARK